MTADEVKAWMRVHPGLALQLMMETDVLRRSTLFMWCTKHGDGHLVEAKHLYKYGPETCHVHPMLIATGHPSICLDPHCEHPSYMHQKDGCHYLSCPCKRPMPAEDETTFLYEQDFLSHVFDYRDWVDPPGPHRPPPPWVGLDPDGEDD